MLSSSTEFRLDHMVTDDKIGDEISARLISTTPANAGAAQAVLDLLDISKKTQKSIEERLFTGLAGDGNWASGKEISKKIEEIDHDYNDKKILIVSHGTVINLYFAKILGKLENIFNRTQTNTFCDYGIIQNKVVIKDIAKL